MQDINWSPDTSSHIAVYKQLADKIEAMIAEGSLAPDDVLWPERRLSETLGVSRGTVRKAYGECRMKNLVTVTQGGYYRVAETALLHETPEHRAIQLTMEYLENMKMLGYNRDAAINIMLMKHLNQSGNARPLKIGTVECRESMFYVYRNILNSYSNIEEHDFLLEELLVVPELVQQASDCDLIIVTAAHYMELCTSLPILEPKMLEVKLKWSDETVRELCRIDNDESVCILYSQVRSLLVVKSALRVYDINCHVDVCNVTNLISLERFLQTTDVLVFEPSCDVRKLFKAESVWQSFLSRGGRFIVFQHYIDPSSVQHINRALLRLSTPRNAATGSQEQK